MVFPLLGPRRQRTQKMFQLSSINTSLVSANSRTLDLNPTIQLICYLRRKEETMVLAEKRGERLARRDLVSRSSRPQTNPYINLITGLPILGMDAKESWEISAAWLRVRPPKQGVSASVATAIDLIASRMQASSTLVYI